MIKIQASRFWAPPGAAYLINIDQVPCAYAEDVELSQGGRTVIRHCLTFALLNGKLRQIYYSDPAQRDTAFRGLCAFVGDQPAHVQDQVPVGALNHAAHLIRKDVEGQVCYHVTGCVCGWRAADQGDPEGSLAIHLAAVRVLREAAEVAESRSRCP